MRSERKRFIFVAVLAALVLLLMAGTVFAQPVITTFKPDTQEAEVGEEVTWTVTSHNAVSYAFYVYKRGEEGAPDKRVHTQWYSANKEVAYTVLEPGRYGARVFAEDAEGKLTIVDSPLALDVVVGGEASLILTKLTFAEEPVTPSDAPSDLKYKVEPDGGQAPFTYAYYIYFKGDGDADFKRVHLQWYEPGQADDYEFSYQAKEPGEYYAQAFVMDGTGKIVNDKSGITKVEGDSVALGITGVESDITSEPGTIKWTVDATGQGTLEYAFYVQKQEEGDDWKRVDLQWYSDASTCAYRPLESGNYRVRVFVLEVETGKTVNDFYGEVLFEDGEALAVDVSLVNEPPGDVGVEKTWKATVSGGAGDCEYAFYVYEDDKRVHMQWYSESDVVSYTPKDADAEYWVRVFVIDAAGTLLVKDSDPINFGGETVAPFGIAEVELKEFSLSDFDKPWVWEVKLNENHESEDDMISYCYYLYRDGDRIETQWYEEEEDTFTYDPRSENKPFYAGEYELRAFAMDEHGNIDNAYSKPKKTRLYHFQYDFYEIENIQGVELSKYKPGDPGLIDAKGNLDHGWVFDQGYFSIQHPNYREAPEQFDFYHQNGTTYYSHEAKHFPLHDHLSTRNYSNQTGTGEGALNCGANGVRTYYHAPGDGTLTLGTMTVGGHDPFGEGGTISPADDNTGCVWRSVEADDFTIYRFAGLRPAISTRPYGPRQEFWQYMVTPNLPYGEVEFTGIHSTNVPDGAPEQQARFNFEFMHHSDSDGVGNDPYDQRVGISIDADGIVRVFDSKAGLGIYDESAGNFYMPILDVNITEPPYDFNNDNWNTLRIQARPDGRIDLILNGYVVYTTHLSYYHITNAERGTITLEVVQAAQDHNYGEEEIDSAFVGNAWVKLQNYSFGIMRYDVREDRPGSWPYKPKS